MRTEWVAEPEALYGVEPSEGLLALALPHERFRPHPLLALRLGPDLNSRLHHGAERAFEGCRQHRIAALHQRAEAGAHRLWADMGRNAGLWDE